MPLYFLADMTWVEVAALARQTNVALVPTGATEAHGPHLPLSTDVIIALGACRRAAERLAAENILCAITPPFSYAVTNFARSVPFARTITIPAETQSQLVYSVCESLAAHGFNRIVFSNHHLEPANFDAIKAGARRATDAGIARVAVPDVRAPRWASMLTEEFRAGSRHAGSYETSLVMADRADGDDRDDSEGSAECVTRSVWVCGFYSHTLIPSYAQTLKGGQPHERKTDSPQPTNPRRRNRMNTLNGLTRREFLKIAGLTAAGATIGGSLLSACAPAPAVPLKVGVLLPYTDIYAVLGESITAGMEMYFDEVGGTAGGRKIQLIKEDEGTAVDAAAQKARKLVEQDEVAFVTGIVSSGVLAGVRDYFHNNKKLLICSNAGANSISRAAKTPYIWRTSFTNWQPNWPMGAWAFKNVGKKAIISVPDYGAGADMASAFKNSFEAAGGQVVSLQKTPFPNMGDPAPFITELKNANPDLVYAFYSGGAAVTFVKAWGSFGLAGKIPLLGAGFMTEEDVLPAQGDAALGAKTGLHWSLMLDTAENNKFKDAYKKKTGKDANVFAVTGYDTGRVIVEMLNKVQGDASKVDKLIEAIPSVSFTGPRGPFTLDAKTQNPKQKVYLREVAKYPDGLHNKVLQDFGEVVDPGDNSKG
ncbi:MAG: ABC transporter substrate-binding protein [Chloroflexi bacterium]|nr:ABC transporter substrate-binding protein [Chloroflexota bacterium]